MLQKAALRTRFEYSLLGSELKKQTDIPKNRYQGLGKLHGFDEEDGVKKLTNKKK